MYLKLPTNNSLHTYIANKKLQQVASPCLVYITKTISKLYAQLLYLLQIVFTLYMYYVFIEVPQNKISWLICLK